MHHLKNFRTLCHQRHQDSLATVLIWCQRMSDTLAPVVKTMRHFGTKTVQHRWRTGVIVYYSALVGCRVLWSTCLCLSVCVPWACLWNRWTDLPKIWCAELQILCGHSSVLLRRCCATLCISSFMDDVTYGRNELCVIVWPAWSSSHQLRARPGQSLMSMNVCYCKMKTEFVNIY